MASFSQSSNLPVSPYVGAIDPQVYVGVGMQQQQNYNLGVSKIQGAFDTIAGMEIVKDSHKQYLQNSISELQTDINRLSGEDFSKSSVVNQAMGLASRIAKDPVIQNAVVSTANYKRGLQQIQDAQTKGTFDIKNKTYFDDQVNAWLNNPDLSTPFNSSYVPYTDITKEFLDVYKAIHPSTRLKQEDIQIGPTGITVTKETLEEGIDANQVADIWNTVSQKGNVRQQMVINSNFDYKGYDKNMLLTDAKLKYDEVVKSTEDRISALRSTQATDKTVNAARIAAEIKALEEQNGETLKELESLVQMSEQELKSSFYSANLKNSLINTFSWSKKTETFKESPFEQAKWRALDYDLKLQQFREKQIQNAKKGSTGGIDTQVTPRATSEEMGKRGEATFKVALDNTKATLNQEIRKHINAIALAGKRKQPWKMSPEGEFIPNVGPQGYPNAQSAQVASDSLYVESKQAYDSGKDSDPVKTMFGEISPLKRSVRAMEVKDAEISSNFAIKTIDARQLPIPEVTRIPIGSRSFLSAFTGTDEKVVELPKEDMLDIWIVNNKVGNYQQREQRLISKYGEREFKSIRELSTRTAGGANYQSMDTYLKRNPEYLEFLEDTGNKDILEQREQAYKDAQSSFIDYQEDFITTKPEEVKDISKRFKSVVSEIAAQRQDNRGEYNGFLEAIDEDTKGTNLYGYYINRLENQPYLTIKTVDGETLQVPVTTSTASLIPGIKLQDEFWRTYGADLSVTGRTTTDIDGSGANAYEIPSTSQSKYKVKYHLNGTGNGDYMLQLTIFDKKGNEIISNLPYSMSVTGGYMTPSEIATATNLLKEDRIVESIILENTEQ